jgi:peptidoglycan-N-acetylglucosamine deacetylase
MIESTRSQGKVWPNGCLGAISLTFDDGRASQLARVVPILEEYELRGTFYLNPRGATEDEWRGRLEPWITVQAAGHEIGNHSLSHVCSQAHRDAYDPMVPSLERWTLADVAADVLEADRRLGTVLPAPGGRTFCYPCYHEHVGEGPTRQSYVPVIAQHFIAARGRGEFGENRPATCDLHYLWSWNVELMDGPALVGRAERASLNRWVLLSFHDVGEGGRSALFNTEPAFRELCAFLARHRERLWTAPVVEVAKVVSSSR